MLSFYVLDNVCYNCLIKKGCWTQLGTLWWLISLWAQIGSVSTLAQQAMILSVKHPDDTVSVSVQFLHTMPSPVESWGGADQRGSTETWRFYPDLLTCSGTLARALRVAAQHRVVALPSRFPAHGSPPSQFPLTSLPSPPSGQQCHDFPLCSSAGRAETRLSECSSTEGGTSARSPVPFPAVPLDRVLSEVTDPAAVSCLTMEVRIQRVSLYNTSTLSGGAVFFQCCLLLDLLQVFSQTPECFSSAGYLS